jgi:hypothetical protein
VYCRDNGFLVSSLTNACNHGREEVVAWPLTDARKKAFVLVWAQPVAALPGWRRALEEIAVDLFDHAVCETRASEHKLSQFAPLSLVGRNGADSKTSTTLRHPPCRTCWELQACHRWLSQGKVSKPDSQITYEQGQTFIV